MNSILVVALGISFTFVMAVLGACVVFLFRKDLTPKVNSIFLGFASGIMIASAIWSLLLPAIEQSEGYHSLKFLPAVGGLFFGTLFLVLMDKFVPKVLNGGEKRLSSTAKLFLAVTLHNIPEGLAVGVAFGNALAGKGELLSALWLAIGIAIQNFPESSAISLPLKDKLKSNKKAFLYSVLSSAIEPVMAVIGIFIATALEVIMPWLLAFAAGSMIFVVAQEMLPEAKIAPESNIGGWGFIVGFAVMMVLEIVV